MVIGLTGQTGAGKTTVSAQFAQAGFDVINADEVARSVMEIGSRCLHAVAEEFGLQILSEGGELDRRALGDIVFSDQNKLKRLSDIINPYILELIEARIKQSSASHILLDAPTLFESGADRLCDRVVCLLADQELRCQRIVARDGLTREQAEKRIGAQHSDDYYIQRSNYVLYNNGTVDELRQRTADILHRITCG